MQYAVVWVFPSRVESGFAFCFYLCFLQHPTAVQYVMWLYGVYLLSIFCKIFVFWSVFLVCEKNEYLFITLLTCIILPHNLFFPGWICWAFFYLDITSELPSMTLLFSVMCPILLHSLWNRVTSRTTAECCARELCALCSYSLSYWPFSVLLSVLFLIAPTI